MRRRGVPLFCIYSVVLLLSLPILVYTIWCLENNVQNEGLSLLLDNLGVVFAMSSTHLFLKLFQMITGWKFLSIISMFLALFFGVGSFALFVEFGANAVLLAVSGTILSLITIILEIRELSR